MHWQSAISDLLEPLKTHPRAGVITDMDGTISPIIDEPDLARVTPNNRHFLQNLQPCMALIAVVSGRAVADVRRRVDLPGLIYVGNHGLEQWADDKVVLSLDAAPYRPHLEAAIVEMNRALQSGMSIEDKGATLTLHYRQTPNPSAAADAIRPIIQAIAENHALQLFEGRMIFELRPPVQINKGTAFRQLIQAYRLTAALYLGDDTTDVDALRMARQLRQSSICHAVGIGVQSPDMPGAVADNADLLASGVSDVETLFDWLWNARKASSTCS
jgi:trehalose 6-phosphate phosphatase